MPECIDLTTLGDYRFGFDPAATDRTADCNPWLRTLLCVNGTIYPFGGDRLAVEVGPKTAKKLAAIPGVQLHQDGDRERTFTFPASVFGQVAEVVLPRRRRRQTPEQRAASKERLARYRFTNAGRSPVPDKAGAVVRGPNP